MLGNGDGRDAGRVARTAHYRKRPLTFDLLPSAAASLAAILADFVFLEQISSMATSSKAKKKTVRIASGRKRARQDVKLNATNTALRSKFRTVVKNVQKAVTAGDKDKATALFQSAQKVLDSVADKGIFHKNKAARHKSRLSAKIKSLSA
jgi:small subunit ribosomal protein S20